MSSLNRRIAGMVLAVVLLCLADGLEASGQPRSNVQGTEDEGVVKVQGQRGGVRPVTIPITVRQRGVSNAAQQELQNIGIITVQEDGEEQKILSIRAVGTDTPISVAILVQDDVV